ncbi:MAG: hypothetical protein JWP59_290, partial [Massilia sp.]|nr:hypothetical protein [Massilia sp.]
NRLSRRETPCFPTCFLFRKVVFDGEGADRFHRSIGAEAAAQGRYLETSGIRVMLAVIQNALVERNEVSLPRGCWPKRKTCSAAICV